MKKRQGCRQEEEKEAAIQMRIGVKRCRAEATTTKKSCAMVAQDYTDMIAILRGHRKQVTHDIALPMLTMQHASCDEFLVCHTSTEINRM